MRYTHFIFTLTAFIFLSVIFPTKSISQENFVDPLRQLALNKELIAQHTIRSLIIYADFNEDGIGDESAPYTLSGKVKEIELDEKGNITYQIFSDENGYDPFLSYGRGSYFEYYTYNENQNIIQFYSENRIAIHSEKRTYDSKGNITVLEFSRGADLILKEEYVWEGGKMIGAKVIASKDSTSKSINTYDEFGRPVKHVSRYFTLTYSRLDYKDSSQTVLQTFKEDILSSTQTFVFRKSDGKILRHTIRNQDDELISEKKARFDEKGNITYYYLNDLTKRYHGDQKYPASEIDITNVYDNRGLLVKRLFCKSREDVGSKILFKIERFVYDTDPLPLKLKPGSLQYIETNEDSYELEPEQERE